MTTPRSDDPSQPDALIVQPFPEVGPLMRVAYRELHLAVNGPDQHARILGDIARLPRPWDPTTCRQADLRSEVWEWLDAVVEWLNHEHAWDATTMIPPCWPRHPHLVHELAVVADQRRHAGASPTSDALDDWHRATLPAFLERMRARLKNHCDDGHQPWPGKGRHARHTDPDSRAERADLFRGDVDAAAAGGHRGAAPQRLSVVDLETGEIRDEPSGW